MTEKATRFVPTKDIKAAVQGREADVLAALGIEWQKGIPHVHCPYPDHGDTSASWRWDADRLQAFCTCIGTRPGEKRAHSIFDVIAARDGVDFEAAKVRVAELLDLGHLIRARSGEGQAVATDPHALLHPPADQRDDGLVALYLGHRLGLPADDVRLPSTPVAGIRSLAYFDPPARKGAKPVKVGEWPCVVFGTVDRDGRRHAHRIYVEAAGAGKAKIPPKDGGVPRGVKKSAKRTPGDLVTGRCVWWGRPEAAASVIVAEGIETAAAIAHALLAEIDAEKVAVGSAIDANGIEAFQPWPHHALVVVAADRDEAKAGQGYRRGERAARAFATRQIERVKVRIAMPGREGTNADWLDVWSDDGPEAVARGVRAAAPFEPTSDEEREHGRIEVQQQREAELPAIMLDDLGFVARTDEAWQTLVAANAPERFFRFAGGVCRIGPDEHGVTITEPLDKAKMRNSLARVARWLQRDSDGTLRDVAPPSETVEDVLATSEPPLPVLLGIVNAPTFAPDGALDTEPGYHPASRLLYIPDPGFDVPAVPEHPTAEDIADARRLLVEELFADFPFDGPNDGAAERAHAMALLLQASARQLIDGATPIFLVDKPTPGSGAGLLVDVISMITTGHPATATTEARDDGEMRKKLTSFLMAGKSVFFLDNVNLRVDSGSLASAVTAKFWEDRVLGETRMIRVPVRCSWIIAGNNVRTSNEIARRCVRIRLDPKTDQPEERSGFKHPNLLGWVAENRGTLLRACLVLVRAWIAAGRPANQKTIGSFEAWCRVMGGILNVAGIPGFLENLDDMRRRADEEGAAIRAFVASWWNKHATGEMGVADLFPVAQAAEPMLSLGDGSERSQKIRLGKLLSRMRDRHFRITTASDRDVELRVENAGVSHQASRWTLRVVAGNVEALKREHSPQHSPLQPIENKGEGECGECGECFPDLRARAGAYAPTPTWARARARTPSRDPEKHSPHSPHSPSPGNPRGSGGECCGECWPEEGSTFPEAGDHDDFEEHEL